MPLSIQDIRLFLGAQRPFKLMLSRLTAVTAKPSSHYAVYMLGHTPSLKQFVRNPTVRKPPHLSHEGLFSVKFHW